MDECFLLRLPVELVVRVFGSLDVVSIFSFRSTCRWAYDAGQFVWSVNRTLKRFVHDPNAFRMMMRDNGAVISGGLALQFFANCIWDESDMDVFVETGMDGRKLTDYLLSEEGYEHDDGYEESMYGFGPVCSLYRSDDGMTSKVQVICTCLRGGPVSSIVQGFYGSAVMNMITWNKAICLFPRTTFLHSGMCVLRQLRWHSHDAWSSNACFDPECIRGCDDERRQVEKYESRGWNLVKFDIDEELLEARSVGDSRCWNMLFDVKGIPERKYERKESVRCVRFALGEDEVVLLRTCEKYGNGCDL